MIEYVLTWWWLACWVSPALSWGGGGGGGGLVLGRRGDPPPFVATFAGAKGIDGPTYPPEKINKILTHHFFLYLY